MPNRILKESITTSCEIDALTADEERFFTRLIVICDDFGRADGRTAILRAKCFPLKVDSVKNKDIDKWIKALVKQNLIFVYEAEGKPHIQMVTWEKHQQIRAKRSKYPAPDDGIITMISNDIKCNQEHTDVPENPIQSNPNPIQADEVWEHYKNKITEIGKTRKKTDSKKSHINARLKDGFTVDQLKTVINNVFSNPFMLGENDRRKMYIEIDNFLTSTEKVEKWLEESKEEELPAHWRIKEPEPEESEEDKPYPGLEKEFEELYAKFGGH